MMKLYKANKKGPMTYLMIAYFGLLAVLFLHDPENFFKKTHWYIPVILPVGLGLWALFHTYYQIKDNKLIYRSGYIRGEIDINTIKEIIKGKTRWVGLKPALATGGIIIKYNCFDDVYLAPKNNEELIADLLKLNGNIVVSE
jgi:hypothetical protein